jgi:thiosulfate/3-mercaptopyruvate sulfurtransferase
MDSLVTTSWLAGRLDDPGVVILDATLPPVGVTPPVDTRARYDAEHIPGAVFFDIEELSDRPNPLPHMLPPPGVFSRNVSALGIGDQMDIIIYEQEGVFSGPRAWWTLRTFGAQNVYLLDGGLPSWIEAGLPTHSGPVHRAPAVFHATLDQNAVKNFSQIQQMIAAHRQILDARSAGRFAATLPEPRPGLSSGHMPGATSIPYTELLKDGRLRPAEELRRIFATKGVDLQQPITTTCGSGVTAAVLALGLEAAGAKQVSLYDGSWAEYAARPEAVIEIGSERAAGQSK